MLHASLPWSMASFPSTSPPRLSGMFPHQASPWPASAPARHPLTAEANGRCSELRLVPSQHPSHGHPHLLLSPFVSGHGVQCSMQYSTWFLLPIVHAFSMCRGTPHQPANARVPVAHSWGFSSPFTHNRNTVLCTRKSPTAF